MARTARKIVRKICMESRAYRNVTADQYCDPVHGCSSIINLDISTYQRILGKFKVII